MYELEPLQTPYERIQDRCYRMNVPVDEFYQILEKMGRTPEEHEAYISDLEKSIYDSQHDWD